MTKMRSGAVPTSSYFTYEPEPSNVLSIPSAVINGRSLYVTSVSVVNGKYQ